MTNSKRGRGLRRLAALSALAVGLLGFTAPASAAVGPNIDAEDVGTITLHKFEQPSPNGDPADGTQQDTTGLTPIKGVVFQYQPVAGVDLTTNDGWDRAAEIAGGSSLVPPEALGTAVPFPATDANGSTSLSDLPLGLYRISEVSHPADSNIVKAIDPFYVTVPLPTVGETPGWNYNIHVYPKNAVVELPTKAVDDDAAISLGDEVDFPIDIKVPAFQSVEQLISFSITDDLDSRLEYVSATVTLTDAANDVVPLTEGTDYTLSTTNPVELTFLAPGLVKLFNAPNGNVNLTITAKVVGDPDLGDGTIENTAIANVNGVEFGTNEVLTTWMPVKVLKYAEGDTSNGLAGAVFEVYDAATGGNLLAFNGVTRFTTNADGEFILPGLKAGVTVYLQEVTAPDGYFALEDRIEVNVPSTASVVAGVVVPYDVQVANKPIPEWLLPLTGGAGNNAFMIAGGVLMVGALGAALAMSRRKTVQA
ncbi:MAG: SpaH/EbpB family LPXTG-anchored major pilin [Brooklawnia sp.]|uniref:SpaH/EbpB family LPXTG-anchored major pilin n=1 Tax=Brooklawnia sp. TaxID=2699740 RepID=UPI003C721CF1